MSNACYQKELPDPFVEASCIKFSNTRLDQERIPDQIVKLHTRVDTSIKHTVPYKSSFGLFSVYRPGVAFLKIVLGESSGIKFDAE
jgi:hypothetical protein